MKKKYISARELAESKGFKVVGKLKRLPDVRYGIDGHDRLYVDEAGNKYQCGNPYDVCVGGIVTADGGVLYA